MNEKLLSFLDKWLVILEAEKARMGATHYRKNQLEVSTGGRYFKITKSFVQHDGTVMKNGVVAFIEKATGDILKPASFNAPAKGARGNIHSPGNGIEAIDSMGFVKYLR